MPHLIDGHNLIPHIPGLSLENIDDETQLTELLQGYCRRTGKRVEVFFDNAPPGEAGERAFGSVKAIFVRQGVPADRAIQRRLLALGKEASNWTVVSSDREVQTAAQYAHAAILPAETFARQLMDFPKGKEHSQEEKPEATPREVDDWLQIFSDSNGQDFS